MKNIINRLISLNRRDWLGIIGWFIVSLAVSWLMGVVGMAVCIGVMAAREVYQWHHYRLERFEWEDVVRYTAVILAGYFIK
jgi:hypothetical protein